MLDQSGNALDPRTPIHRAAIDLDGATEAHLAGHGSVSLSTLTPTYQSWSAVTTLADDAPYFGVESPAVLACWISSHPEIEIKSTGQPDTYVIPLERAVVVRLVDHNGKPTISMIEFLSKDDQPVRRIEFSEFTEIPGLPGPVGRVRVNSRRSSGQAELQETSKDRLVFMEAVATPDDSYFQLDLTGRTTVDAASGEIRNETGTVVGKVSARRAIGHVQQWAVLVVCAGVGLSVGGLVIAWKRSQS